MSVTEAVVRDSLEARNLRMPEVEQLGPISRSETLRTSNASGAREADERDLMSRIMSEAGAFPLLRHDEMVDLAVRNDELRRDWLREMARVPAARVKLIEMLGGLAEGDRSCDTMFFEVLGQDVELRTEATNDNDDFNESGSIDVAAVEEVKLCLESLVESNSPVDAMHPFLDRVRLSFDGIMALHAVIRDEARAVRQRLVAQGISEEDLRAGAKLDESPLVKRMGVAAITALLEVDATGDAFATRQKLEYVDRMLQHNLRLVAKIALPYRETPGLGRVDLFQEGVLGLMRAIQKWDWRRGRRFSTYATWWIGESVWSAVPTFSRLIRLPTAKHDLVSKVRKAMDAHLAETGQDATDRDIMARTGISEGDLKNIAHALHSPLSLSMTVRADGDDEILDFVPDEGVPGGEMTVDLDRTRARINVMLDTLPRREADILRYRFGLVHDRDMTLSQVGEALRLTRERCRQLEHNALEKLRRGPFSNELQDMLEAISV